jgi:hypothetical protein
MTEPTTPEEIVTESQEISDSDVDATVDELTEIDEEISPDQLAEVIESMNVADNTVSPVASDDENEPEPEIVPEVPPVPKFVVFYNHKILLEVIAAVLLRENYNCEIISLGPDLVAGTQIPDVEEFILLGSHWNKKIDITLKLFPAIKITVFNLQQQNVIDNPRLINYVGENVCTWIRDEFSVEIPDSLISSLDNADFITGLTYSYVNDSLEERVLKVIKDKTLIDSFKLTGQYIHDFRTAIARERVRNFAGIITARNGHRFSACHAPEFNREMHEELKNAFPEADGTLIVVRSFRFDVTTYELASEKINVLEQLINIGGIGTSNIARGEVFGNHMFPPF